MEVFKGLKELPVKNVKVTNGYWKEKLDLLKNAILPYQLEHAKVTGSIENYKIAAGLSIAEYKSNHNFQLSIVDMGKLLETAGYVLMLDRDAELEAQFDEIIDYMEKAQLSDGYLQTRYIVRGLEGRFKNLEFNHELYHMGMLSEGLLSYYTATGNKKALNIACGMGDCMVNYFGYEEGKIRGYDGHPNVELALVKLFHVTGEKKYFNLSKFFVDIRGEQPHYYDAEWERVERVTGTKVSWAHPPFAYTPRIFEGYGYFQAHKPAEEQDEPVGHAVRGAYFYAGMADVAQETHDSALFEACKKIWDNIETNNIYITGGIGQEPYAEAFGKGFDLPPDNAYNETCASIALVFFAQRMLKSEPNARYADVMEKALYNGIMSGISLDGVKYFYVNPLEVWPYAKYRNDKIHVETQRQPWFDVPCCPPNIARLIGSISSYTYLHSEDEIYVNLYMSSETAFDLACGKIGISQDTNYPWDGKIRIKVSGTGRFTLKLRIPGWSRKITADLNGVRAADRREHGYFIIDREWNDGDKVEIDIPMRCEKVYASPDAYHMNGRVAITRGPIVYCLEEIDNGAGLQGISLPVESQLYESYEADLLGGVVTVYADAFKAISCEGKLYDYNKPAEMKVRIKAIPYYTWANRGEGEMLVWIREK